MKSVNKLLLLVIAVLCPFLSEAQSCTSTDQLQSPLNHTGNGQRGTMFDVEAINNITIRCFEATLYSGITGNYEIYYKVGTHVGFQNNASAWTKIGNTVTITSLGYRQLTPIPIDIDLMIPAGQTYAFYITNTGSHPNHGGIYYTNGGVLGSTLVSDGNLEIKKGRGKSYPFANNYVTRNFNGRINYDVYSATVTSTKGISCLGNTDGEAEITMQLGTPPYTVNGVNYNTNPFTITGLGAGSHTFTVVDSINQSDTTTSVTIGVTSISATAAVSSDYNGSQISCATATDGAITVTASGGTDTFQYSMNGGAYQASNIFTSLDTGSYTFTIKDVNCPTNTTTTTPISLTAPTAISATASVSSDYNGSQISCATAMDGAITVTASGGTDTLLYSMNGGAYQASNIFTGLGAGSYTFTIKDVNNCTTTTTSISITAPTAITATAAVSSDYNGSQISCATATDGAITVTASGGTDTLLYSMNGGAYQASNVFTGLGAGSYTFTIKDVNNCTTTTTPISISVTPVSATAAVSSDYNGSHVSCATATDGAITVTASGGTGTLQYSMNGGAYQASNIFTGLGAGSYTFIIQDVNCLTNTMTTTPISITAPTAVSATATVSSDYNGSPLSCDNVSDGAIAITATGGTGVFEYSKDGVTYQSSNVLMGFGQGTHTVYVKDVNNCTTTATASITMTGLSIVTSSTPISCNGYNDGTVSVIASGGTAPYTYNWDDNQITSTIGWRPAGTYYITVTDVNGCTANDMVILTEPTAVSATITVTTPVSCYGASDAIITASATGGNSGYTYNWSNGSDSATANNLSAGIYHLTVTDANNCTGITQVTVTEPSALFANISIDAQVTCNGGTDGSLTVNTSGGTAPYQYSRNGGTSQNTGIFTGLSAQTHHVIITDANNCTYNVNATITAPNALVITSNVSTISCNGGTDGSAILTVSGGIQPYSYVWSNGATASNLTGAVAGNYMVTVTDANNCQTTETITITAPTSFTATATVDSSVTCNGGNNGHATVNVTGGVPTISYNYTWDNGETTAQATNLTAGTHTVTVTNANGCAATASVLITEPTNISATMVIDANVSCNGGTNGGATVNVTGGTAPYTYTWSNNATTSAVTGLAAGTYTVTINDANGCMTTSTATIIEQSTIQIASTVTAVKCNGGNDGAIDLTITGGVAPYTFVWDNGAGTNEDIQGVTAGTYNVIVTDANNCTVTQNISITEPVVLSAVGGATTNFNGQGISCFGAADGGAFVSVVGGTAPYTYAWSNGETTSTIANLTTGTYTVSITDANNCTTTALATITGPTQALAATVVGTTNITCNNANNGAIDLTVVGGTLPYTYFWSNGTTIQDPTGLDVGYQSVTITDANGCTTTANATISEPAQLAATATPAITYNGYALKCNGDSDGAIDLSVTGGTAPFTYVWSNGQTTDNLSGLNAGIYSVIVTDANNCTATTTITLTAPSALSTTFNTNNIICHGANDGTATVIPTGGVAPYTVAWDNGSTNLIATNLSAGTHTVIVTDANGCTMTSTVTITQPTILSVGINTTQAITCNGGTGTIASIVAGGTAPYTYAWSNGATTANLTGATAGTHTLVVTDANNCSATKSITVSSPTSMIATIASTDITCNGLSNGSANLSVSGGTAPYTYAWTGGQTTEDLTGAAAGTYTVVITDANGCTTTATATITTPTALAATASATDAICNGGMGSVSLNVAGGTAPYTYTWNNNSTMMNLMQVGAGTYSVTVTDASGCQTTTSAVVSEPVAMTITSTVTDVTCNGATDGAINIAITGGTAPYTYNWDAGVLTQDLSNVGTGIYTLTATDALGCTVTHTATVNEPSVLMSIGNTTNVTCNGNTDGTVTTTVTGGTAPYSYAWSNGATTANLTGVGAGVYTVIVTDANSCQTNSTFQITAPTTLAITVTAQSIACNGGTSSLSNLVSGGTAPYTVTVTDGTGATVSNPNSVGAGTYTVSVTDANGCSTSEQVTLTEPTAIAINNLIVEDVLCAGAATGSILIDVTGGAGSFTYTWNTTLGVNNNANNLTAGNYSVTVTDFNGCTATGNFTINEPTAMTLSLTTADDPTTNQFAQAEATVTGGVAPYTYQWDGSTGSQTTATATNLKSGLYSVVVTDANGCTTSGSIQVIPTSTENLTNVSKLSLFPNPTVGQATIELELGEAADVNIGVYNVAGIRIQDFGNEYTSQAYHQIDLTEYAAGVYLVRVVIDNAVITKRLVVVRP